MFIFLLPLIIVEALIGVMIGWVVGQKRWGRLGAIVFSVALGLAPALTGLGIGIFLLQRSLR